LRPIHRAAARLRAQGCTFKEISQQLGYNPNYWGRLAKHSTVFKQYLQACIDAQEQNYMTSTQRLLDAAIEQQLVELLLKRRLKSQKTLRSEC
jgi:YesN/AraC family two-component response regulator